MDPGHPRRTIARPSAAVEGVGLFTGARVRLRVLPARDGGVRFRVGGGEVRAVIGALCARPPRWPEGIEPRSTSLASPPAVALTVEHVCSALVGLGVTDAVVELDAPETPALDGSAAPIAEAIARAGVEELAGPALREVAPSEVIVVEGARGARITAEPRREPGCEYVYELDYGDHPALRPQRASIVLDHARDHAGSAQRYREQVAPARTFCLDAEASAMRARGLFAHLTTRDMLVIGPDGPIDNTLRFDDEPARHKLLDLVGDLALVGAPIRARIVARGSGHALNHALAAALARLASA